MNLRPSGYEPDELPDCSTPRHNRFLKRSIIIAYALGKRKRILDKFIALKIPGFALGFIPF